MLRLNISATAHALNYLPQYYAAHVGLFAERDLAVGAVARDPWTQVLDDLDTGVADIALGGLWVPAMYHGGPRELTVVAQVNHQFPKALVMRTPTTDFHWNDLVGKTVLAPGIGGSAPYAFTAGLIREAGVDPAAITFLRDLSTPMYVEMFTAGLGDAIVTDLVTAELMQHNGIGHIVADYTEIGGLGPNSVYYCRSERFAELSDRLVPFVAALQESMQLLTSVGVADLAPLLRDHWPTVPPGPLSAACERMLLSQTWATPIIDSVATDRWTGILFAEKMVAAQPVFTDLVSTAVVDRVGPLAEMTPR